MATPNWTHWADPDMEFWTPEQAISLSLEIDPDRPVPEHLRTSYAEWLRELQGAIEAKDELLTVRNGKVERFAFVFWASQRKGWDISRESPLYKIASDEPIQRESEPRLITSDDVSAQHLAEMVEFANTDGKSDIDWEYWITRDGILTAAEAVRLMSGLDPDQFPSLEIRHDERAFDAKKRAKRLERRAQSFKAQATPAEWLDWAASIGEAVHLNFGTAVDRLKLMGPCNAGGIAAPDAQCVVTSGGYMFFHDAPSTAKTDHRSGPPVGDRAASLNAIAHESRARTVQTHRIKTRRYPLDTEIDIAKTKAANPDDPQSIWDTLCAMADKQETEKLLGLDEGGVKYRNDRGEAAWLSKRAFMARWNRRNG